VAPKEKCYLAIAAEPLIALLGRLVLAKVLG
jgi:hypothetical protein